MRARPLRRERRGPGPLLLTARPGIVPSGRPAGTGPEGTQRLGRATQRPGLGTRGPEARGPQGHGHCQGQPLWQPAAHPVPCPAWSAPGLASSQLAAGHGALAARPAPLNTARRAASRSGSRPLRGGKGPERGCWAAAVRGQVSRAAVRIRGVPGALLTGPLLSQRKPWFAHCGSQPRVTAPTRWVTTSVSETRSGTEQSTSEHVTLSAWRGVRVRAHVCASVHACAATALR